MTFELRIIVVGLAAFAASGLIGTVLVPLVAGRWATGSAARRAARLAHLRMLPSILAGASAVVVAAAFFMFEPRWDGERVSLGVRALAGLTALLLASGAWRGLTVAFRTRRVMREWLRSAEPVTLPGISATAYAVKSEFPIVAVVGIARPRLIIAESVLASCSDDELRAVLAHEQGHIARRDNLRRLLMAMAPDVLTWLPTSAQISAAWHDASEEAADDAAANSGADGGVRLASALVKVARLAPAAPYQALMPASALYRGEDLNRRVRRLLQPGGVGPAQESAGGRLAVACLILTAISVAQLENVHDVVEGLIHVLP